MKIKNALNAKTFPIEGEVNNEPSATVPDMGYTVAELLYRQTNGLPITASVRDNSFDENDDTVDLGSLDIIDREAYVERYMKTMSDLRKKDADRRKAAEDKLKKAAEFEKELREYLASKKAGGAEPPAPTPPAE